MMKLVLEENAVGDEDVANKGEAGGVVILSVVFEKLLKFGQTLAFDDDVNAVVFLLWRHQMEKKVSRHQRETNQSVTSSKGIPSVLSSTGKPKCIVVKWETKCDVIDGNP